MAEFKFNGNKVTTKLAELFKELCIENLDRSYPYAPGYNLDNPTSGEDTKTNTGKLASSISITEGDNEATIEMEDYGLVVNFGRRPGLKPPPSNVIEKWINSRSITIPEGFNSKSLAFVIARSIGKKGIAPTNFLDDAITDLTIITSDPDDPRNPFNQQDVTDEVNNFVDNFFNQLF